MVMVCQEKTCKYKAVKMYAGRLVKPCIISDLDKRQKIDIEKAWGS